MEYLPAALYFTYTVTMILYTLIYSVLWIYCEVTGSYTLKMTNISIWYAIIPIFNMGALVLLIASVYVSFNEDNN